MRISLKRVVQWVCFLALLQIFVYYWTVKKPRRIFRTNVSHKYLSPLQGGGLCSNTKCPAVKDSMINVHLIPHSHIDVGWTKSVEQYYVGEQVPNVWATGCVRCTFNATITELLKDPARRFILVEMKYLSRYWDELLPHQRETIYKLIKERRLEIANGGWVMSDAAVTMYNDIIDQHTLGFDFVKEKFGSCAQPRTGWHVDQFGHSREHASIFAQMGFDSLFIGRLDYEDFAERKAKKNLEFVWETSPQNLKDRSTLFTHFIYNGYYAPVNFMFETDRFDWSDPGSSKRAANEFIELVNNRARAFQTNHVLIPMGCDFGYKDSAAANWFDNMDNIIKNVHEEQKNSTGPRYNVIFSTPSCYTYQVNKARVKLETKTDDFHPYGIEPGVYWTGYFTTRGGLKMFIKRAGRILQACKQLSIFNGLDETFDKVNELRDAMGVMQHHDAITGTQRYAVLHDYSRILSKAVRHCEEVISQAYDRILNKRSEELVQTTSYFCHDLNISSCDISENSKEFLVSLYNPLSWPVDVSVRLPLKNKMAAVLTSDDGSVPVQLVPVPQQVMSIPEKSSSANTEAVFMTTVPPLSSASFKVITDRNVMQPYAYQEVKSDFVIENQYLFLKFSGSTGKLMGIYNKHSKIYVNISQEFAFYESDLRGQRTSGAYLFVPKQAGAVPVASEKVDVKVIKGPVVNEVHQRFSSWVSQVVRLYKGSKFVEFQWVVGPLDDAMGREVITRFISDLDSKYMFYTDSNGREVMPRVRQTSENTKIHDVIAGNYFPVTSRIFIQDLDKKVQLTVLPDRTQGGSSLAPGCLELMVHRRLLSDDNLGVGEPIVDPGIDNKGIIYTGKHYLAFETIEKSSPLTRHMALQLHLGPVPVFTPLQNVSVPNGILKQTSYLSPSLPDNVQVLTLDRISPIDRNMFLLRLEHVFEENEHSELSKPVEVELESMFTPFLIVSAEETTLGGNFRPHDISRLQWETASGVTKAEIKSPDYKETMEPPFKVKLQPMEIRSFRVQVSWL